VVIASQRCGGTLDGQHREDHAFGRRGLIQKRTGVAGVLPAEEGSASQRGLGLPRGKDSPRVCKRILRD
jgi:hypothetical protein